MICATCNGKKQVYVEWADDYGTCYGCGGSGVVKGKRLKRQLKAQRKRKYKPCCKPRTCYRIQVERRHYNDWDVVSSIEWRDVRVVETLAYGAYLVKQLNAEVADYGESPYRLVRLGRVIRNGKEAEQVFGEQHFSMPWER